MSEFQDAQREFQSQRKAQAGGPSAEAGGLEQPGSQFLGGGSTAASPDFPIPRPGVGFAQALPRTLARGAEAITGAERSAALEPEFQQAPEIRTQLGAEALPDVELKDKMKIAAGLTFSSTPEQKIDIIQSAIPEADIRTGEDGVTRITVGEENFVLNAPGISQEDLFDSVSEFISFLPIGRAGLIAKGLRRIGILVGGGAATSAARDVVAGAAGSEQGVSGGRAAAAGALEVLPDVVGGVVARRARGRLASRAGIDEGTTAARRQVIDENLASARQAGIRVTPGQASESPRALFAQERIAQTEEGALAAGRFFREQTEDAFRSVDELSEAIAPGRKAATASAQAQQAIELRRQAIKQSRAEVTSPLYNNAFEAGARVDTRAVVDRLDTTTSEEIVSGPIHDALSAVKDDIAKASQVRAASGTAGGSNIKALHNVRRTINERIAKQGEGGLGPQAKAELLEVRDELTRAMEDQSDFYRGARERYIAESPELNAFDESILAKARRVKPENVDQVRTIAFKDVASMKKAKAAINDADPSGETWDALLRSEMDFRMRGLDAPALAGEAGVSAVSNTPGQIRSALFGKGQKKRIIMEAMSPEQRKNAMSLDNALRIAGTGRKVGSPTQPAQQFRRELEGAPRAIAEWITSPLKQIRELGSERVFRRNAAVLSELIFNNKFSAEATRIRVMRAAPTAKRRAMAQLLNRVGKDVDEREEEEPRAETLTR